MKVFIKTLGCPKNLIDSEVITGYILKGKNSITKDSSEADVIILNTCAFIQDAVRESVEEILYLSNLRGRLIVTGCLPQRFKKASRGCDFIVGLGRYDFWERLGRGNLPESCLLVSSNNYIFNDTNRVLLTPAHYAYLRIAEGCSNRCSYCIIPYIRGPYRSKKIKDIVTEAEYLRDAGVKEFILIAQDTTNYGIDIYGEYKLPEILQRLSTVDGVDWIRLLYAHPAHLTDDMIDIIRESKKIVKYIDLPIQHISNSILKSMRRKVTRERIEEIVKNLRTIPGMHIRSEVMVGYPGEGEKEFAELIDFLLSVKFDSLGLFKFSLEKEAPVHRDGTSSDLLSIEEIEERYDIIMEIARQLSYEHNCSLVGRTLRIIVDGLGEGRTQWQSPEIDGVVFFEGDARIGEFTNIKITNAEDFDLFGVTTDSFLHTRTSPS
ncbi:MAG: 30S ribosomal protein S12 methylthiotransferase RimO [bacterium (Candidatus Stahlbacteria) CG08_land_8_20_14_0_20_40_26]|nr:MAG: 30S ribosomal protein S12 methylthiotransferase RimO [bacterium (Candidatus Stahlbacteria) CG23_combo_of_CG06-09_8_20_14_all_40_9]PIS23753.1 MAG: 30S ribosomal protein S12 methylthiotransferase RimO [bacterium (Candidatus Stahlbacteria) CG08_land_8_20_14_0_20_40_26]